MATGMVGYVGVGVESSGAGGATGAWSAAIVDYIPFTQENLTLQRNDLPDPSIWANFYKRRIYNGLQRVEGGISVITHPLLTGYFLRSATDTTTTQPGWESTSHAGVRNHRFVCLGTQQFQTGSGSDLPTLTLEVNRGPTMGAGSSFVYYNCAANTAEFVAEAGQLVRANFEFMGRDYGGKPRTAPVYVPQDAFLWNQVSVSVGGVAKPIYEALTVRIENSLEAVPTLDGRLRPDLIKRNDFGKIVVNGTVSFRDFVDYDAFLTGSQSMLQMTFTGKAISTAPANNEMLKMTVPQFRYSTFPINAAGPGRISIGFTGEGMIDQSSNYALEFSIVNTRISAYNINAAA